MEAPSTKQSNKNHVLYLYCFLRINLKATESWGDYDPLDKYSNIVGCNMYKMGRKYNLNF